MYSSGACCRVNCEVAEAVYICCFCNVAVVKVRNIYGKSTIGSSLGYHTLPITRICNAGVAGRPSANISSYKNIRPACLATNAGISLRTNTKIACAGATVLTRGAAAFIFIATGIYHAKKYGYGN